MFRSFYFTSTISLPITTVLPVTKEKTSTFSMIFDDALLCVFKYKKDVITLKIENK